MFDAAAGLQTIHAGHAPVHKHDVVRFGGILLLNGGEGFFARGGDVHAVGKSV